MIGDIYSVLFLFAFCLIWKFADSYFIEEAHDARYVGICSG